MRLLRAAWLLTMIIAVMMSAAPAMASSRFAEAMRAELVTDPSSALSQAEAEMRQASARGRPAQAERLAEALWVKAQAEIRLGQTDASLVTLQRIVHLRLTGDLHHRMTANVSLLRGLAARQRGDFPAALNHYRAAQTAFIAAHDERGQGQALQALGALYTDTSDSPNAFRYLELAEEAYSNDDIYNLSLNNNFGVALVNAERPAEAVDRYSRAAEYADRLGATAYATTIRHNIAIAQIELGRLVAAAATLRRIGDPSLLANPALQNQVLRARAMLAFRAGRTADAVRDLERIFADTDLSETSAQYRFAHTIAYQVYEGAGQPALALRHLEAVRRLEEADSRLLASNRAALLAAQFGYDAQNARIDRLRAEQLARNIIVERQRSAMQRTFGLIIIGAGVVALAALAGMLVIAMRARNQARRDEAKLAVTNAQLEEALAAKSEFLASTSHEMRTPLNGILGMSQILLADSTLSAKTRGQVELVHSAGTAMRVLVDDLLDIAKIEHGGFTIAPRAALIAPIIDEAVAQFRDAARIDGLTLDAEITLPHEDILIDPDRMRQIIVNLIGNAVKFTERGGVVVRVDLVPGDRGPRLRLAVSDSGGGIAPEWHEKIFLLFQQVDGTRTRSHGGTGLGLAICRQLAQAMGGDVALSSTSCAGTTFTVDLPYQPIAVGKTASTDAKPLADIIIIGADPLRAALLHGIAKRSGRSTEAVVPAMVAARLDEAAPTAGTIILMDAQAVALLPPTTDLKAVAADIVLIIAGDSDALAGHQLTRRATCVPFAVNALLPLLGSAPIAGQNSTLQISPPGSTILDEPLPSTPRTASGSGRRG